VKRGEPISPLSLRLVSMTQIKGMQGEYRVFILGCVVTSYWDVVCVIDDCQPPTRELVENLPHHHGRDLYEFTIELTVWAVECYCEERHKRWLHA
jgi:hypothetical protein